MTLREKVRAEQVRRNVANQITEAERKQRLADADKLQEARKWVRQRLQSLDGCAGVHVYVYAGSRVAILRNEKGRELEVMVDWFTYGGSDEAEPVAKKNIRVVLADTRTGQIGADLLFELEDSQMENLDRKLTDWVLG
jgi:hypothetical protein